MKIVRILSSTILFVLILSSNAVAYIGLCCAHCGGNMPLNILGGGIPETHEFRFKISEMFMRMDGLRDGTAEKKTTDYGPSNSATHFRGVPKSMESWMTMVGGAYSFTDDFAAMIMMGYVRKEMDMDTTAMMGGSYKMFSQGMADTKIMGKYRLYSDDHLAQTSIIYNSRRSRTYRQNHS